MTRRLFVLAALGVCFFGSSLAEASTLEFDFQQVPGAAISFNGTNGTFQFTPTSGPDFVINYSSGTGSALGLNGTITGTFTIGTITTSGGVSSAPVTGTGTLDIADGSGHDLTATITMGSPTGISKQNTLPGNLNPTHSVNLSGVHYSGSNSDLSAFANAVSQNAYVSFFDTHTLSQLKSGGSTVNSTMFSGALTAIVPEPGTIIMALAAVPALGGAWLSRRRRKAAV